MSEYFPTIVCLCGSTRFWREFQRAGLAETMAGRIVLSIGAASGTDDEHFGNLPREEYDRVKTMLDELHMRKIEMADEVLILNKDGYIGESTARELAHARYYGKLVRFLWLPYALELDLDSSCEPPNDLTDAEIIALGREHYAQIGTQTADVAHVPVWSEKQQDTRPAIERAAYPDAGLARQAGVSELGGEGESE